MNTPITAEDYSAQIPALQVLMAMKWRYLSPEQCLRHRGGNQGVVLTDVLIDYLRKQTFECKGRDYPLSTNAIEQILRDLTAPALNEGLAIANEKLYEKLIFGVTVTEFIDGKKYTPTIPILNWTDPLTKNAFHVTEELEVLKIGGVGTRRPDIVCYVNGLPLVVIEAKRPDSKNPRKSMVEEGISQNIRNQGADEIPNLFAYPQLLFSINGTQGRYGTTRTPAKFWASWREEEFGEDHFKAIKNTPLSTAERNAVLAHRTAGARRYFDALWSAPQRASDQDRLLISLLEPARFLEFIRLFILFDKKTGKIAARYQQAFGIKKMLQRVTQRRSDGGRRGGVVWHSTGSGKSFTMVFLCKALLLHEALKDTRVIVVTDRVDLEKQLAGTFLSGGAFGSEIGRKKDGEKAKVTSGRDLAKRIGQGRERIIFTILDKFRTACKLTDCKNTDDNMIVLVDEGHRSTGGETFTRMQKALPNAAYITFTGTPLLKDDKTTNKFGAIIHAYTMQRAVEDKTVTPLLYEERRPQLDVNAQAIDKWFERITIPLSDDQKTDLKRKWSKKGAVYKSDARIQLLAWDIADHFFTHFKQYGQGLKGQLATDSKLSAIRYKKYLDETGLVSSAVIISPPDTREGHSEVDEAQLPEVQDWWKRNVPGDAKTYEAGIIDDFGTDGAPDILIVVDKLLTGFDEPRNAVLYIDKDLKQHNLIQAIARVNRLHEAKTHGLLIDYRGILKELDTTLQQYRDLADRTHGYDFADIDGLYHRMSTEYKRLPGLHDALWALFEPVENKRDREQFRHILIPKFTEDEDGQNFDSNQKIREDFYEALTDFGLCLKLALSSRAFFEDGSFSEADIQRYKDDLRWFTDLRKIARQDAQETVDYAVYEDQIRRLVDQHVVGTDIKEGEGVIDLNKLGDAEPENWSEEKTRNETDIIRSRIKKTIEQELADDPYAQQVFSKLLRQAIRDAEAMFDYPAGQYALFKEFEDKVKNRDIAALPDAFGANRHAKAYFGVFLLVLGEDHVLKLGEDDRQALIDQAFAIDLLVQTAVATHSLNPQNIESEIRKGLLPDLFKRMGLDTAKQVIEKIIQITRVGLNKEGAS